MKFILSAVLLASLWAVSHAAAMTISFVDVPDSISDLAFQVTVNYSGFPTTFKGLIVSLNTQLQGVYLADGKSTIGSATSGVQTVIITPPANFLQTYFPGINCTLQAFMIDYQHILENVTTAYSYAMQNANYSGLPVIARPPYSAGGRLKFMGMNIEGGEVPGIMYEATSAWYFRNKGYNFFNVYTSWSRIFPVNQSSITPSELSYLMRAVNYITKELGAFASIELHDYGRYSTFPLGTSPATATKFGAVWYQLANAFKNNSKVIFSLINSPHDQDTLSYMTAVNTAISAIRQQAKANNMILVQLNRWGSASNFFDIDAYGQSNAELVTQITDSNTYISFKQYFDADSTGVSLCSGPAVGAQFLSGVTLWLRKNNKKAFLGEFGAPYEIVRCKPCVNDTLSYLEGNSDVWMGWAWWNIGTYFWGTPENIQPQSDNSTVGQEAWLDGHLDALCPTSYTSQYPQTSVWSSCTLLNGLETAMIATEPDLSLTSPLDGTSLTSATDSPSGSGSGSGSTPTLAPGRIIKLKAAKMASFHENVVAVLMALMLLMMLN